jgi:hypothetical protein
MHPARALVGIAIGLIGAVAFHGDATLLKVRDSLVTGVFGAALPRVTRNPASRDVLPGPIVRHR